MNTVHERLEAGGAMPPASIKVWDPLVRVFHWSLATLFVIAYVTADEIESVHLAAGYAIAALVALRVVWGFVGSRYARFNSFVRPPREVLAYLGDMGRRRAPRFLGHNPAGGVMIVALLVSISGLCVTGYMMTMDAFWGSALLEDVHSTLANVTIGLVALHVLGVLIASVEHGENLVKAMFSGRKRP